MNQAPSSNQLHSLSIGYGEFVAVPPSVPPAGVLYTWTNNLGCPIFIVGVEVWVGEEGKSITDTPFSVINRDNGDVYVSAGWDHYSEPCGISDNSYRQYWAPFWYLCQPGETIQFSCKSIAYNPTPQSVAAGCLIRYLR